MLERSSVAGSHPDRCLDEPSATTRPTLFAQRAVLRLKSFVLSKRLFFIHLTLIALSAWLAFNWYGTIQRLVASYMPAPFMDYWRVVLDYTELKGLHFQFLWWQHNEHRILFPEIVCLLDMLVWHGEQFLPLAVSFLCYFSVWLVIAWAVWSDRALSRLQRALAILLPGIVISWKGCVSALAFPFLLQWTLTQLAAILSVAFLTLAKRKSFYLVLAITAAVIATYSSGNGMALWPALIAAGFLLNLSRRQIAALIVSSILSIGLYFVGYRFSGEFHLTNFFVHPLYSLGFISMYFSMPFGAIKLAPFLGVCVGAANLCAALGLLVYAAWKRLLNTRPGIVLFGCYAFALLTAILTAVGRMDIADQAFIWAKADRYVTVPIVSWGVLIALFLWVAGRCGWRILPPPALGLLCAGLLVIGFHDLRGWIRDGNGYFAGAQAAILSFENDLEVPNLMLKIFPDPRLLRAQLPVLRRDHLSLYFKDRTNWLGQPVTLLHPFAKGFASGSVTKTAPVAGGLEVLGWADDGRDAPRYRWIVLVNEADRIAGFGERLPAGTAPDLRAPNAPHLLSWVGFINSKVGGSFFHAYLVCPENRKLVPIPGISFGSEEHE